MIPLELLKEFDMTTDTKKYTAKPYGLSIYQLRLTEEPGKMIQDLVLKSLALDVNLDDPANTRLLELLKESVRLQRENSQMQAKDLSSGFIQEMTRKPTGFIRVTLRTEPQPGVYDDYVFKLHP